MSGFEIAGIVLAVIPLVLDAVKDYPKTSVGKKTRTFLQAAQKRREFASELLSVGTALRGVMIDIFMRVNVSLTQAQREALTGPNVAPATFFEVWNEVFDSNPDEIRKDLCSTIEDIRPVLQNTEEILLDVVAHTEIPQDEGREQLRKIMEENKDDTFAIRKHLSNRFNFAKSSLNRDKLVGRMKENIDELKELVKTQKKIDDFRAVGRVSEWEKSHTPFLERVRGYSDDLYCAISGIWQCMCHKSPAAMLRLEKRETPADPKAADLRFSLILTFEHSLPEAPDIWTFRETEVSVKLK